MTIAPERVVAVVSAPAKGSYAYVQAAVYELQARKDGVLTYRRSGTRYAWPHRSRRLAEQDAQEISQQLGIPFWPHVRHHMTTDEAADIQRQAELARNKD